jgi:hypothetical protein
MPLLPPPRTAPGPKAHVNIYHSLPSLKLLFWPQPIKKLLPPHSTGPDCKHSTRKLQQNGKTGKYIRKTAITMINFLRVNNKLSTLAHKSITGFHRYHHKTSYCGGKAMNKSIDLKTYRGSQNHIILTPRLSMHIIKTIHS